MTGKSNILFGICWFFQISYSKNIENYLINTSKCTVPDLPPFFTNWPSYISSLPISCSEFDPLPTYTTVKNNVATLHVREEAFANYSTEYSPTRCCYSYVFRNGTENQPDVGISVTNCLKFQQSVVLLHDTVWVSCSNYIETNIGYTRGFPIFPIYANVHQVVRPYQSFVQKGQRLQESSPKRPTSVLVIVIDSVSRLNFIRTMPKTREYILKNGFHEFKGYNKIDDNTFPNAMALLTGMNLRDSFSICQPRTLDGLNNCQFIWKDYQKLGYSTAYAEDWAPIATFNYFKKGFRYPPTDYYFKPYMDVLKYLETKIQDDMPFCAGPESQGDRTLNLAYDFATTLKDSPSFGIFWMNTFSHNVITTPKTMDERVKTFFEKLKSSGVLDESIVVLLSDHGVRFGNIINTTRGYYELRLPMNYVSLPDWFITAYPKETRNFDDNTKLLTSTYDMYMTLQHILSLSGTNYTMRPSLACPNCRSLFEKIPLERSCNDAGIPDIWCTCNLDLNTSED
ncbi:uncharacterized protein LOC115890793 isoform X2 [Sitophilus oryzae]|nr:uncharacterized protein LOC115890793 isoform X2 [Sitophilus oryzae]XP_030766993.1 uncharacterized protein LOC115890793 isoform X2 [Sitophilus oryzae]